MNPSLHSDLKPAASTTAHPVCPGDGQGSAQGQDLRLGARVFEFAREGILITDAACRIVDTNPAFTRITGYAREEVLGQTPHVLSSGRHGADFYHAMWHAIQQDGHWSGEIWDRRKDGETYPERLSIAAIRDPDGAISHFIGVFTDISLEKRQAAQLEHLAHHDALTGVPNRILLADRIQQAVAHVNRGGGLLAVGYLDLDGFKPINDSLGHEVGDRLLVEMARRLQGAMRGDDTLARLGGDEFALLLLGLETQEECEFALSRLLDVIAQPIWLEGQLLRLTASIGVSIYPWDDEDPDTLLRHADQAMYATKQSGRGSYTFYDLEGDRRARNHRQTQEDIRRALDDGQFVLYYQPQVSMSSGKIQGAEALIRWRHPQHGLLSPAAFLPMIENTELDIAMGQWVLGEALRQLDAWRLEGLGLTVGVNISARHLQQPDFFQHCVALLVAHPGVSPRQLKLEILETTALEDLERVSRVIRDFRNLGMDFALDDFGTGYSSLTYLKSLPVQTLKIDHTFVRDMLRDPDDLAIVEGVIALAEAFGRDVIAEGVESLEAGLLLLQLGCSVAQGYGIAHPMPAADLPAWVAAWKTPHAWSEDNFKLWHREDFALLLAEHHHREWIDQLARQLHEDDGHADAVALNPEACRFGRWQLGSGQMRYGHLAEFTAIATTHADTHALGAELLALLHSGRQDEALRRLPELFAARDALLSRLHALQHRILASRG